MLPAPKSVLCIHDLSGLGRSSLSVILPVLCAMGVQAVALPTTVLSTHTGGLGTPAQMADAAYGPAALEHYRRLGMQFDCIYSGYLATLDQARLVEQAMELWPQALSVVDPVMGDNGRLYSGISPDLVGAMYTLCSRADVILPNLTEAALLLDAPGESVEDPGDAGAPQDRARRLSDLCAGVAIVTGIPAGRYLACAGCDNQGESFFVRHLRLPRSFPGTGDIFGAVLTGGLVRGNVPEAAADAAASFVAKCIELTPDGTDPRLGVWVEAALPTLLQAAPPPTAF